MRRNEYREQHPGIKGGDNKIGRNSEKAGRHIDQNTLAAEKKNNSIPCYMYYAYHRSIPSSPASRGLRPSLSRTVTLRVVGDSFSWASPWFFPHISASPHSRVNRGREQIVRTSRRPGQKNATCSDTASGSLVFLENMVCSVLAYYFQSA